MIKKYVMQLVKNINFDEMNNDLTISYNAPTQHLIKINQDDLKKWKNHLMGNILFR